MVNIFKLDAELARADKLIVEGLARLLVEEKLVGGTVPVETVVEGLIVLYTHKKLLQKTFATSYSYKIAKQYL